MKTVKNGDNIPNYMKEHEGSVSYRPAIFLCVSCIELQVLQSHVCALGVSLIVVNAVEDNSAEVFLIKLDKIQKQYWQSYPFPPRRSPMHIILLYGWESLSAKRNFHLTIISYMNMYKSQTSRTSQTMQFLFNFGATAQQLPKYPFFGVTCKFTT